MSLGVIEGFVVFSLLPFVAKVGYNSYNTMVSDPSYLDTLFTIEDLFGMKFLATDIKGYIARLKFFRFRNSLIDFILGYPIRKVFLGEFNRTALGFYINDLIRIECGEEYGSVRLLQLSQSTSYYNDLGFFDLFKAGVNADIRHLIIVLPKSMLKNCVVVTDLKAIVEKPSALSRDVELPRKPTTLTAAIPEEIENIDTEVTALLEAIDTIGFVFAKPKDVKYQCLETRFLHNCLETRSFQNKFNWGFGSKSYESLEQFIQDETFKTRRIYHSYGQREANRVVHISQDRPVLVCNFSAVVYRGKSFTDPDNQFFLSKPIPTVFRQNPSERQPPDGAPEGFKDSVRTYFQKLGFSSRHSEALTKEISHRFTIKTVALKMHSFKLEQSPSSSLSELSSSSSPVSQDLLKLLNIKGVIIQPSVATSPVQVYINAYNLPDTFTDSTLAIPRSVRLSNFDPLIYPGYPDFNGPDILRYCYHTIAQSADRGGSSCLLVSTNMFGVET